MYFNLNSYPLFDSASWYGCMMVNSSSLEDSELSILFIFSIWFFNTAGGWSIYLCT